VLIEIDRVLERRNRSDRGMAPARTTRTKSFSQQDISRNWYV